MPPTTSVLRILHYLSHSAPRTSLPVRPTATNTTHRLILHTPPTNRTFITIRPLLAQQDYGSGAGDPVGENPKDQPASLKTSDLEHPGPPPPDVGQGSGSGPTKGGGGGGQMHQEGGTGESSSKGGSSGGGSAEEKGSSSNSSSSNSGKSGSSTTSASSDAQHGSSKAGEAKAGDTAEQGDSANHKLQPDHSDQSGTKTVKSGAKPKFNTEPPKDVDQDDVKKHNEDVDRRSAKRGETGGDVGDKVGKGFWSGQGSTE